MESSTPTVVRSKLIIFTDIAGEELLKETSDGLPRARNRSRTHWPHEGKQMQLPIANLVFAAAWSQLLGQQASRSTEAQTSTPAAPLSAECMSAERRWARINFARAVELPREVKQRSYPCRAVILQPTTFTGLSYD